MADDLADSVGANKSASDALDEIVGRQSTAANKQYNKAFFQDEDGTVPRLVDIKDFEDIVGTDAFRQAYNKARRIAANANSELPPFADFQAGVRRRPMEILDELDQYTRKNLMDGPQGQIDRAAADPEYRAALISSKPQI